MEFFGPVEGDGSSIAVDRSKVSHTSERSVFNCLNEVKEDHLRYHEFMVEGENDSRIGHLTSTSTETFGTQTGEFPLGDDEFVRRDTQTTIEARCMAI